MIEKIATDLSSFELYTIFKDCDYSFILDSNLDAQNLGRYSFISANPFKVLKTKVSSGQALSELQQELEQYQIPNNTKLPFVGGAVGYLAYDLCHCIEDLPQQATDDLTLPDLYMGLYDWVLVVDHLADEVYFATPDLDIVRENNLKREVLAKIDKAEKISKQDKALTSPKIKLESNFTKSEYIEAIKKIRDYIAQGTIYQVNLSQRFSGKVPLSSYDLYKKLREISPAPFAAFLNFAEVDILSNSPERFIQVRDGLVETRPIKGTRPRGKTVAEDKRMRKELLNSAKDKSELLMIVDLERNDLAKVSQVGSVNVPELYKLEEYANVHHLVATINSKLKDDYDIVDLLRASFPGGSITGTPKIRSMKIIDQLEPTKRSVYTGSIGYIGFDGATDLNIAIRTIIKQGNKIDFQVGGGITWDSNPEEEYYETLHKADSIMKAVNGYYAR